MFVCDRKDMDNQTCCIFLALLGNLIDSEIPRRGNYFLSMKHHQTHTIDEVFRRNIRRIFQIVRKFGQTAESFWDFLEKIGCVTSLRIIRERQRLPNARVVNEDEFRVDGHAYSFPMQAYTKEIVCTDFKAMKLVRWDAVKNDIFWDDWCSADVATLDVYQDLDGPATHMGKTERDTDVALRVLLAQLSLRL